jgi:threonine dehydrogenase-like Zn-dependent dehydrogenase
VLGSQTVRAATLVGPRKMEVRQYPFPHELEPGAVLIRMIASGICGTDKHTFRGETVQYAGTPMERTTPFPIIQGHENLGIIEAIGEGGARGFNGKSLEVGERVVPAPNRACGKCISCKKEFPYYLCRNLENYGNSLSSDHAPHLFGGWSEFLYLKPGTPIFQVPPPLSDRTAVLTEIFAVTHSLERAAAIRRPGGFLPGDTVAVIGVGSLGMAHLVKAALMGAGKIIAIDRSSKRLQLARELVEAQTVRIKDDGQSSHQEITNEVRELNHGEGPDLIINATGFPGSFGLAQLLVRDAGTIIEVGAFVDMGSETFNPAAICGRSLTIMGVGGEDAQAYYRTMELMVRNPSLPFEKMISHIFPIEQAARALEVSLDAEKATKVLISDYLPAT